MKIWTRRTLQAGLLAAGFLLLAPTSAQAAGGAGWATCQNGAGWLTGSQNGAGWLTGSQNGAGWGTGSQNGAGWQ